MSTADKLNRLLEVKANIRQAIVDKGVEVAEDTVFADYATKISAIEVGGTDEFLAMRTNNGTDMSYLFYCYPGNTLDVSNLDTSNVRSMKSMFAACIFTELDLSNFNTSNATYMTDMFSGCMFLEKLNLSNFTAASISMGSMFVGCEKLYELRLDNCDNETIGEIINSYGFPTNAIEGVQRKIHAREANIGDLEAPENWVFLYCYVPGEFENNTETEINVFVRAEDTDLSWMFSACTNLTTIHNIENWDTSNVTTMEGMFYRCTSLTELDLSSFNTSNVVNMNVMFRYCSALETLDIRNFDMTNVTDTSSMFGSCYELRELRLDNCSNDTIEKIINSSEFPTNDEYGVTRKIYVNPNNIFGLTAPNGWIFVDETGEKISEIPIEEILVYTTYNKNSNPEIRRQDGEYSGFVRKVEDMGAGYYKIIIGVEDISNPPIHYRFTDCNVNAIEKINIDYLTDMNSMFENSGLTYLDASDWNVSNVQDMGYLFSNCSLNELYISGWNTGCVSNMSYMFNNCSSLGLLDLSNFDTRNVGDMSYMFNECNNLYELNLSNFDMTNTYSVDDMFYNCWSLSALRLDYCSIETVDKIVNSSNFPADNSGIIYCSWDVYYNVTPPGNWTFQAV